MIVDYTPDSVKLFAKTYLFDHKKPSLALCISVVVPVRNEAHHLVQTLESLRLQQDTFGQPLDPALY